ncbi:polysaccharide deacetylase family protein [Pectinatus haikarae]|uniref:Peptidoglycan/xylan/chitin deacetylase (PgdA/CDA1 family) n=1 Tax=Pectinatus haikarae TaxID=349096 RepID=A0ABT9YAE7_9FIRM|nr:polysaccharide deacetylase family protein [Pectinatus haikarae]MDQ0204701.1 peptidoglycan/xylan/chitin deacetylase (PgdA/CDA1 family) [Pectinatus haikarae]
MIIYFLAGVLILAGGIFWWKKIPYYIPILMYHRIACVENDRNSLSPEKFAWQLKYLFEHNFHTVTPDMLYAFYSEGRPLPKNPILLTFDDGYMDNFTAALPLLEKYSMTAVVFPITKWVGRKNQWENFGKQETTTMNWANLQNWLDRGQTVASHTETHPFLPDCGQLQKELSGSKKTLEKNLNTAMSFLCYPYGKFDKTVIAAAKKAGYKAAFAIFENVNLKTVDLFALPRIPIPAHQSEWEFNLKISRLFIIFIALRKWERALKKYRKKFSPSSR